MGRLRASGWASQVPRVVGQRTPVTRMLEQARERAPLPAQAAKVVGARSRFARDPQEFQGELALGLEADPA